MAKIIFDWNVTQFDCCSIAHALMSDPMMLKRSTRCKSTSPSCANEVINCENLILFWHALLLQSMRLECIILRALGHDSNISPLIWVSPNCFVHSRWYGETKPAKSIVTSLRCVEQPFGRDESIRCLASSKSQATKPRRLGLNRFEDKIDEIGLQ